MRVDVKFGTTTYPIEVENETATLGELRQLIYTATGVLPALQKLLGKPKLQTQPDSTSLAALKIQNNTKLMLIGSTAAAVAEANAPSAAEKQHDAERAKMLRNLPLNFWLLPAFGGFLGDPYIAGRGPPLEGGSATLALLSLDVILSRLNTLGASGSHPSATSTRLLEALGKEGSASVSHRFLRDISAAHRMAIQKAHAVLRSCHSFTMAASQAVQPDEVLEVVDRCVRAIDTLPTGEWLMLPSGWMGTQSFNVMFVLICRSAPEVFDLVVVNRDAEGQMYHPRWQSAEKIVACPYLRLERIAKERLLDKTFWLLLLSLWMRQNDPMNRSEFIRAEVFYDVLLPWLVEKDARPGGPKRSVTDMFLHASNQPLSSGAAARREDATSSEDTVEGFSEFVRSHGANMPCSESSAIKSAVSAFTFLLEEFGGMSAQEIKHIRFVLKYEFFLRAAEDLGRYAKRFLPDRLASASASSQSALPPSAAGEQQLQGAIADLYKAAGTDSDATDFTISELVAEARKHNIILKTAKNVILQPSHFENHLVLVYVGGLHFPGGKSFAALLAESTEAIQRASSARGGPPVELLFLSCDKDAEQYEAHAARFTFPRASFPCLDLLEALDVSAAPEVLVFQSDGRLLHRHGVAALRADPEALLLPDGPWKHAVPLSTTDVRMLEVGAAQLAHHTRRRAAQQMLPASAVQHVVELLQAVTAVVQALPHDNVHDISSASHQGTPGAPNGAPEPPTLQATLQSLLDFSAGHFVNADLLPTVSTAAYFGTPFESSVPALEEINSIARPTSLGELHAVLGKAKKAVLTLWQRASHSGTTSRVAVQLHIIEFITWLFTAVVPVPLPPRTDASGIPSEEAAVVSALYTQDAFPDLGEERDAQTEMLEAVHYLMLSFTNAWQAVETPTRAFDAERCLIGMDLLLVVDALARQERGSKLAQLIAVILNSEGGYYPSTSLGKQSLPFATVAATLELTRPELLPVRSAVLRYITFQTTHLSYELFDLRMPDKLELRKGSHTVNFLRAVLHHAGFALEESGGMFSAGASEMEKLMEWFCSARSPLAAQHPAFGIYRDAVLLAKFLGTMEMRDAQLLHRRKELDPLASWRLSFEEDAPGRQMSAGWRTRPEPPLWECVMVRGRDLDIADIIAKGFGDRELLYGEGLALHSPIDVGRLLEVDHPSEDDVLHAKVLPSYAGTMSPDESEVLLSCLTTPYVRIPLVLDFFSSQDRNTYLFVREQQEVLRAVLFEPAAFCSAEQLREADPRSVPMRLTAPQRAEVEQRAQRGDRTARNYESYLGTTYGLLLNELCYSPAAVLHPLRRLLESITELGPSSVYSANASYVLFVVGVMCDVLGFCRFASERRLTDQLEVIAEYHRHSLVFLRTVVGPLLQGWLRESEHNADSPTQCVIFAYKGMVDRALWRGAGLLQEPLPLQRTQAELHLRDFIASSAFVRARHGFGLGMQRTQLAAQAGDELLTPEEKMCRFLQAQGLDTSAVSKEMLEQGKQLMLSGGRRRAVFVQIRSRYYNDTVRVPNVVHSDASSSTESKLLKLPPADVPENVLFASLLEDHRDITAYLDRLSPAARGALFQHVVQCVLSDHAQEDGTAAGAGREGLGSRAGGRSRGISPRASVLSLDEADQSATTSTTATGAAGASDAAASWAVVAPGIYRGPPSSGLLFHAQTSELFWRNDELKPVPDSMSHFVDFENILGTDILQCGLVSRHTHRHWVHIVGTPYDVMEWTAASPEDQGVHAPIVTGGKFPKEPVTSAVYAGVTYDRPVDVHDDEPWPVKEERWAVDLVREVFRSAFKEGLSFAPLAAQRGDELNEEVPAGVVPSATHVPAANEMHFIMNDAPQYLQEVDRATWKEIIAYRLPQPHFDLFNLVPHARKLHRSLVFSTNQRYCLHSLALLTTPRTRESLKATAFEAGELKRRVQCESTLEIHRYNHVIRGREAYIPARLLQGLIPSALLESFFFWQGEDDVLRGYPLSEEREAAAVREEAQPRRTEGPHAEMADHWFAYSVEVFLHSGTTAGGGGGGSSCTVVRREDKRYTPVRPATAVQARKRNRSSHPQHSSAATHLAAQDVKTSTDEGQDVRQTEASAALKESKAAVVHAALGHLPLEACRVAIERAGGDITGAMQWLTDPANRAELQAMQLEELEKQNEERATVSGQHPTQAVAGDGDDTRSVSRCDLQSGDLVLVNLTRCPALSALLELFVGVEDCSHILVWGRAQDVKPPSPDDDETAPPSFTTMTSEAGCRLQVESVELPRLRAKFVVRTDSTSARPHLFLLDHPGWRIAEPDDFTPARSAQLRHLRAPLQQCLVLSNATHDAAFMVPNHDFSPLDVRGDPFSPLLLFDRSSFTWRQSVPSPFFLYLVHSSAAFVVPPTLSASLYYAALQCATQHYAGALRTLESCYTDCPFTPEEAFMFALFERTTRDRYPDAHAVRLKLAHAVQYSHNHAEHPLAEELAGYLSKKRHVSADCRLTRGEVMDLLKRCEKAVPLVRAQLELYAGLLKHCRGQPLSPSVVWPVQVTTPRMDRCGYPWSRLLLYPWERISSQRLRRVTYKPPPQEELVDANLVTFLWEDKLLSDVESGADAGLGFYFLYSMKKSSLTPSLGGRSVAVPLTQLMSRWFHLRHARWGRESQADGESELPPSWCATVLQLMELSPSSPWPEAADLRTRYVLIRGGDMDDGRSARTDQDNPRSAAAELFSQIDRVAREVFTQSPAVEAARSTRREVEQRTPESRSICVEMHDHIVSRVTPQNTARSSITLVETALAETYFEGRPGTRRATLEALCEEPLRELGLMNSVVCVMQRAASSAAEPAEANEEQRVAGHVGGSRSSRLPFDLQSHPLAQAPLAQDMLTRLEEDAARFEEQQRTATQYGFTCLAPRHVESLLTHRGAGAVQRVLTEALSTLQTCVQQLHDLSSRDAAAVSALARSVLHLANQSALPQPAAEGTVADASRLDHYLLTAAHDRRPVPLEWLCAGLLSTTLDEELRAANPFHGSLPQLEAELVLLMLLSHRDYFAEQAAVLVRHLVVFLELCGLLRGLEDGVSQTTVEEAPSAQPQSVRQRRASRMRELVLYFSLDISEDVLSSLAAPASAGGAHALPHATVAVVKGRLQQLASTALDALTARRHYTEVTSSSSSSAAPFRCTLDPRFLIFEFLFNILLRARQVEMVRWFVENMRLGQSRVQQMIMGQGKTTVVGPLLALILADGQQLVTQVMPTALLEQTRGILRRCFSVVLVKHIYTLQFDRNFDDDSDGGGGGVELLYQKLKSAEADRAVVIAAPECIKSLFLKCIEQLHMLRSIATEDLSAEVSADERYASQAGLLLRKTVARSDMADRLVPILQLWKRGVLIMDEVDVLLHPLRSELNFPIGLKYPIDLSGPRWLLPIRLLDAVFSYRSGRVSEDAQRSLQRATAHVPSDVDPLSDVPSSSAEDGAELRDVLRRVQGVIAKGFATRALQREPHLVLLDADYYETELLPALIPWLQPWLHRQMMERLSRTEQSSFALAPYEVFQTHTTPVLRSASLEAVRTAADYLNAHLTPFALQLLNLAHDWLHRLLPHVLSKIDRVSFGVLQPSDLALASGEAHTMPFSRRMMAVPFIAKDVPSRSSEFAHPDVVIGLTVLAFRYEGLRLQDVRELLQQLRQDFARQEGPKEHRPAAKLYKHWLRLSAAERRAPLADAGHQPPARDASGGADEGDLDSTSTLAQGAVPLSQLQLTDRAQMSSLHRLLRAVPEVIHYYLCSCIFPLTMNFQRLKISACGHELGSSLLFTRRIGFSGTPSNLLPLDLGECFYEPGSDGKIISVLTNPSVVHTQVLPDDWSPLRVLDRIAAAQPPYHALIDAGALITHLDNEDVARYLLARLPESLFDGVCFIDARDRQVVLQRDNGLILPAAQCGVSQARRFTFFDQVHTTGTDAKQSSTATAVITLGKDLVFRDYAQGAYRMRGIGKGQRLCLYLIPEVLARIDEVLGAHRCGDLLRDVPAWLLLNSMKIESLQFFKLSLQELANVWRKKALQHVLADATYANTHPDLFTGYLRSRRFHIERPAASAGDTELPSLPLLVQSIEEFQEVIEYPIRAVLQPPLPFLEHVQALVAARSSELIAGDPRSKELVHTLLQRMTKSIKAARAAHGGAAGGPSNGRPGEQAHHTMDLNAEIVHEQEAEEEQEQEAEQEEQRISAFSRDDESQIPWMVDTLSVCGSRPEDTVRPGHGSCFYQLSTFQIDPSQPHLRVSPRFMLSDNYYRLEWHGVGERRLKNAFLFVEWVPQAAVPGEASTPCAGLVTLAEGESLRWLMHHSEHVRRRINAAVRFVSTGQCMEATPLFRAATAVMALSDGETGDQMRHSGGVSTRAGDGEGAGGVDGHPAALLYRFLNNDMFFSKRQLRVLERLLRDVSPVERLQFFVSSMRVRRRHRNHWEDAPIASLFVLPEEKPHLQQLIIAKRVELGLEEVLKVLIKARLPRASKAQRHEGEQAMAHVNTFSQLLQRAASASSSANHAERDANEEASAAPSLLASTVAGSLIEAFPRYFKSFSAYDLELALVYAVFRGANAEADLPALRASRPASPAGAAPAASASTAAVLSLSQLYSAFPLMDMRQLHARLASAVEHAGGDAQLSREAAEAAAASEPWQCPVCTFINAPALSPTAACAMCMTARPRAASADGATADDADEDDAAADGPWPCGVCTFINESRTQPVCSVCLAPNPSPLASEDSAVAPPGFALECPEGCWVCSVEHGGCSKFNPNDVFYCQVCEKARPNLASVRF